MVAHLRLHTHELLYEDIGNIIAEIISAWKKAECYEEVPNHSQRIFTLIQNNDSWGFLTLMHRVAALNIYCNIYIVFIYALGTWHIEK